MTIDKQGNEHVGVLENGYDFSGMITFGLLIFTISPHIAIQNQYSSPNVSTKSNLVTRRLTIYHDQVS